MLALNDFFSQLFLGHSSIYSYLRTSSYKMYWNNEKDLPKPRTGIDFRIWHYVFVPITFIMLIARLYIRIWLRREFRSIFTFDGLYFIMPEIIVTFAWLTFLTYCIIEEQLAQWGWYDRQLVLRLAEDRAVYAMKLAYASVILYLTCLYMVKLAFLCFFNEFVPKHCFPKTWIAIRVLAGACIVALIYDILIMMLWCRPLSALFTIETTDSVCLMQSEVLNNSIYLPHIITDVLVYCIPFIPLAAMSNISAGKRIGASIIFSLGFVTVGCSIVSFGISYAPPKWYWQITRQYVMLAELTVAVMISCCPAFKALMIKSWNGMVERTKLSSFMQSISRKTMSSKFSSTKSSSSKSSGSSSNGSQISKETNEKVSGEIV